jgi:predicted metalloprotease with PDZ domain
MRRLRYTVQLEPRRHQLHLTLDMDGLSPGSLRLAVPTWIPGAYAFLRYGRDVLSLKAEDAGSGAALAVTREGWSGWRIDGAGASVRVRVHLNAWDPATGELAGLVDESWALLLATRYPFPPEAPSECEVEYRLPDGWPLHHPSGAVELGPRHFRYQSHAALLDTPVVAGEVTRATRTVRGTPFHALFLSVPVGYEEEGSRFLDGLERVAESCHDVFGSFPFADYTFIFDTSSESGWGMEHASSTLVTLHPEVFVQPRRRMEALRVCAHELFHAWNGARLKAAPLGAPDLLAGSFPDALWLTEGFTRYYEFILGARGGWLRPEDVLANLVNYHRHLKMRPAFGRVSPMDSSRAAFLNHHRFAGAVNASLDYYDLGMLVAFDVDVRLRVAGDSLDAALRDFFEAWAGRGAGYTSEDAVDFLSRRQAEAGALAARAVREPAGLQTEASLALLGFEVAHRDVGFLGLVLEGNVGPKVIDVADASPAADAGLAAGDELLAVEGRPFRLGVLGFCLERRTEVSLTVRRAERSWNVVLAVGRRRETTQLRWTGSASQAETVRRWLGRPDFAPAQGEEIRLEAYDNFHGIQTVF